MSFRKSPTPTPASPAILADSPSPSPLPSPGQRLRGIGRAAAEYAGNSYRKTFERTLDFVDRIPTMFDMWEDQPTIIPDWMEPTGFPGLYMAPDIVSDPLDCERFPNSPYCGGPEEENFRYRPPLGLSPDFAVNRDLSEICVSVLAHVSNVPLASIDFCYRAPWARPLQGDTPPLLPTEEFIPWPLPQDGGLNCWYHVYLRWDPFGFGQLFDHSDYVVGTPLGILLRRNPQQPSQDDLTTVWIVTQTTAKYSGNPGGFRYWRYGQGFSSNPLTGQPFGFYWGKASNFNTIQWLGTVLDFCETPTVERPRQPSPPPFPIGDPDDMSCCAETEELLRLIARRLGTDSYPVKTPQWLMKESSNEETHESLTELTAWFVKQIDGLFGQFPINVTIEDIDPTTEGNQEREIQLPNLAEAIAELYGLTIKNSVNGDIAINFLTRLASEIISVKNAAVVTQDYARANASFLGYRGNPKAREIDYAFNPEGIDSLDKILKESKKKVIGWQNDDSESVVDFLQKIVFSAGIIKAVFMRRREQAQGLIDEIVDLTSSDSSERTRQNEDWKAFINELNNPESGFNKDSFTYPVVTDYSTSEGENFPVNPDNQSSGNG